MKSGNSVTSKRDTDNRIAEMRLQTLMMRIFDGRQWMHDHLPVSCWVARTTMTTSVEQIKAVALWDYTGSDVRKMITIKEKEIAHSVSLSLAL